MQAYFWEKKDTKDKKDKKQKLKFDRLDESVRSDR